MQYSSSVNRFSFRRLLLCGFLFYATSIYSQVSNYTFQQLSGTYSEITGGTLLGTASANNYSAGALYNLIYTINPPFAFNFNGFTYSTIYVHSTGYITFGTPPTAANYVPISTNQPYAGVVSAWESRNGFFNIGGRTSQLRWETLGTAPNRVIVIQWKDFRTRANTSTVNVPFMNYQIRLYETTRVIEVMYGESGHAVGGTTNTTAMAQVGLRGGNFNDFKNLINGTATSINAPAVGTNRADQQNYSAVNGTPGAHANGKIYRWTPTSTNPPLCVHPDLWGTINAPATCTTANVNNIWAGQYSVINNIIQGNTYQFSSSIPTDWLTLTDASNNGLISGTSPITWTATFSGTIRLHVSVNDICNSDYANFRNTTVQCLSCCNPCQVNTPLITVVPPNCSASGSASISNFNAAYTYAFSPVGPSVNAAGNMLNLTPGISYTVIADNGTCASLPSASFSIGAQAGQPAQPAVSVTPASCITPGTASISNFNSSVTYQFTPAGPSVNATGNLLNLSPGVIYTVTANDGVCSSTPSLSFSVGAQTVQPAQPQVSVSGPFCTSPGGAFINNFNGSYTYVIIPSGPSVDASGNLLNLSPGTDYTVTASDGICPSIASASFSVAPVPVFGLAASGSTVLCAGQSVGLTASGASAYLWLLNGLPTGQNTPGINATQNGNYGVVLNQGSCTDTLFIQVSISDSLLISPTVTDGTCGNPTGSISLSVSGGTAPYTYQWNNGTAGPLIENLQEDNYSVTVTDAAGCAQTGTYSVLVGQPFTATASPTTYLLQAGEQVQLDAGSGVSFVWTPPGGLSCTDCPNPTASPTENTVYTVTVTDALGCVDSATVTIEVADPCCELVIPNVFTPNGDGVNDIWEITAVGYESVGVVVYNRWGGKVWESEMPLGDWNGKTSFGRDASAGTYYYVLRAQAPSGETTTKTGALTISR